LSKGLSPSSSRNMLGTPKIGHGLRRALFT
jgi:hypothetical protein